MDLKKILASGFYTFVKIILFIVVLAMWPHDDAYNVVIALLVFTLLEAALLGGATYASRSSLSF
jgi:hypothetical protein